MLNLSRPSSCSTIPTAAPCFPLSSLSWLSRCQSTAALLLTLLLNDLERLKLRANVFVPSAVSVSSYHVASIRRLSLPMTGIMGNSNSRYEPNMLSNLPPGYIPAYPAVPPYAMKKKGWNIFGKSRKKREEELKQYFYTTPFVWMYPPGSSCTCALIYSLNSTRHAPYTRREVRVLSI